MMRTKEEKELHKVAKALTENTRLDFNLLVAWEESGLAKVKWTAMGKERTKQRLEM